MSFRVIVISLLVGGIVCITEPESLVKESNNDDDKDTFAKMVVDVVIGTMLVIFTPIFLWFAETQVVKYETIVRRCQLATRKVKNTSVVRKGYESRPIYVQGTTRVTKGAAVDSELGYSPPLPAARLERSVEMYQWIEEKNKDNNGNESVTYKKCWLPVDIPSFSFRDSDNHRNPTRIPNVYSTTMNASQVQVGEYILSSEQVNMLVDWKPGPVTAVPPLLPRALYAASPAVEAGYLIFNGNLAEPRVGTVRVSYRVVKSGGLVSTIGVQKGRSFRPFLESDAHRTTLSTPHASPAVRSYHRPSSAAEEEVLPGHLIGAWSESQDTSEVNDHEVRMRQAKLGSSLMDLNYNSNISVNSSYDPHSNRRIQDERDEVTPPTGSPNGAGAGREDPESAPTCCESLECCAGCCYCMCCQPGMACLHQLADWTVGSGILLLEEADVSVPVMFRHEWQRFTVRTWVIRFVSYVLLGCGLYMMFFGPVVYLVSFIPYVGWFVGRVLFIAALMVGLLEGLFITTIASVFHRPILLTGYLLAIGAALWFGAQSAGWILAGQILCLLSVLPLGLYLYQWVEEWRFVALQKELDKAEEADESMPLVNVL